jgi:hypothetical protein
MKPLHVCASHILTPRERVKKRDRGRARLAGRGNAAWRDPRELRPEERGVGERRHLVVEGLICSIDRLDRRPASAGRRSSTGTPDGSLRRTWLSQLVPFVHDEHGQLVAVELRGARQALPQPLERHLACQPAEFGVGDAQRVGDEHRLPDAGDVRLVALQMVSRPSSRRVLGRERALLLEGLAAASARRSSCAPRSSRRGSSGGRRGRSCGLAPGGDSPTSASHRCPRHR